MLQAELGLSFSPLSNKNIWHTSLTKQLACLKVITGCTYLQILLVEG